MSSAAWVIESVSKVCMVVPNVLDIPEHVSKEIAPSLTRWFFSAAADSVGTNTMYRWLHGGYMALQSKKPATF